MSVTRSAALSLISYSGASIVLFFLFAAFMLEVYYLSIGLQAAYNLSATDAGVRLLPLIMTQIVILIASSRVIAKIGRFKWVIVAGPCFLALGSGLLYSVKYGTPIQHIYGFQVFMGVGIGLAMQNSMLAVQFELKDTPQYIAAGTGLVTFSESFFFVDLSWDPQMHPSIHPDPFISGCVAPLDVL